MASLAAAGEAGSGRPPARRARDLRLDFFRGIAMFIIFIAHMPGNSWLAYIPAQFGWSSGAELFVFLSGLASGLAFGKLYESRGFILASMRVVYRVWQVYWAHIVLGVIIMGVYFTATQISGTPYYERIGLTLMREDPVTAIPAYMMLNYFVAYTDILPMYVVLLAAIPLVMALRRLHPFAPFAFCGGLWLYVQIVNVWFEGQGLPALRLCSTPDCVNTWYFNPFAWQLVFFTGFFISMGWVRLPAFRRGPLFWVSVAYLVVSAFLVFWLFRDLEHLYRMGIWWEPPAVINSRIWDFYTWLTFAKYGHGISDVQILRYLHLLALGYVVLTLLEPYRDLLAAPIFAPVVLVGQQSLATFLASTALALTFSIALDLLGRNEIAQAAINLAGFALIVLAAYVAQSFKAQPWRPPRGAAVAAAE